LFYVGELGPAMNVNRNVPNLGPRLSVLTNKGETLVRLGDLHQGTGPGQFMAPHGLAVDSHGDIYVGEVSFTNMRNVGEEPPDNMTTLRKLVRINN
ncbi:MAG: hypothetical protein VYA59_05160, partial [Pseudomonadota bacterium]|nr:hypothetical protein [Pseudomonadota bacterium]